MNPNHGLDGADLFIASIFSFLGWLIVVLLIDATRAHCKKLVKMGKEDGKHTDAQVLHLTGQLNSMIAQQRAMVDELRKISASLSGATVEIEAPYAGPTLPMAGRARP